MRRIRYLKENLMLTLKGTFVILVLFTLVSCKKSNEQSKVIVALGQNQQDQQQSFTGIGALNLNQSNGASTNLSNVFKGEYLVIDLSATNCTKCLEIANSNKNDTSFSSMFSGNKCSFATLIPNAELGDWNKLIGRGNFVSERSYGIASSHVEVAKLFNMNLSKIPAVFIVDKNWKVVKNGGLSIPESAYSLCGNNSSASVKQTNSSTSQQIQGQNQNQNQPQQEEILFPEEEFINSENCDTSGG